MATIAASNIAGMTHTQVITVVWELFTVGIFHVRKFHVKIFSSSWVKCSYLLPYFFNNKNISCVKFSSWQAADENLLTVNFSQTTVYTVTL